MKLNFSRFSAYIKKKKNFQKGLQFFTFSMITSLLMYQYSCLKLRRYHLCPHLSNKYSKHVYTTKQCISIQMSNLFNYWFTSFPRMWQKQLLPSHKNSSSPPMVVTGRQLPGQGLLFPALLTTRYMHMTCLHQCNVRTFNMCQSF